MAHMRTQIDLFTKHIVAKSGKGYNSGNTGWNYARDGQYDRPANRDQGNWQNRYGYRNYCSGVYVPPGNKDRASGSSNGSKLEDMMAKDGNCMAIATRSGKVLTDPISVGTKHEHVLEQAGREEDKAEQVDDLEDPRLKAQPTRGKEKEVEENLPLQQIPKPPPHFPQRLKKKDEDGKFTKFITMLKQLSVNIPLMEALEQMPGYAKFIKDLVTKKRVVSLDFTNDVHHCSAIATRSLVQKKEYLGAFTIPCTIGLIKFAKDLCDLEASINLMPLNIYKKLGLGVPRPTTMRLMMADRSVKRPVGVLCDVLVKVDTFIFPVDFVILDCEVDFEVPIILRRPFLATGRALVDVKRGELKFRLNKDEVKFNICMSMKQPNDMNVVSAIEMVVDEDIRVPIEERMTVETLVAVLMNFDVDFQSDYIETVNALQRIGAHSYAPKKLDLDLQNRPSPPAKPSIEEPSVLELKQLPSHLRYKREIGWTVADIIGIPHGIWTNKIQLEEDCNPSIEHQRRLNPPMQEISIAPEDQEKTIFTCPYGTFAFKRMPFGLCNAPATFQKCMMSIFADIVENTLEVFMDDFSVVGDTFDDCLLNVSRALQRCEAANLVLNWEKCHFMVNRGIVLGHKVSQKGIEVDKPKIEVIEKLPLPIYVKGVRSFLGHTKFYRCFIKDFSKIAHPMCNLLEKEVKFVFDEACLKAFLCLKKKLISTPVIIGPDWSKLFEVMCDASGTALGVVLGQKRNKMLHPIYHASKSLNGAQRNYTVIEQELLVVVYAFEKF
ncbi:uncharacterized protein LOC125847034 [Solanum stenotomum]|uniref:uncharacterized protein LOC125847034 n=1 Tax=Solanum stenotomum TaxID=172797 RepID=UPI0020D018E7|nr:uncharacterized protein LOC125847034 [Solanum stenotomum]